MAAMIGTTVASIPSPSFNSLDIGPLSLNVYGLMIALGIVCGVWLFGKRLEQRGFGNSDDASSMAIWAVVAGVIGARLYHVATDWDRFANNYGAIPKIWEGGLGIPGGLLLGTAMGLYMARQKNIPISIAATCAAPAVPLAQAIGRWGNYFNQELYGRATELPWALQIDADHLVVDPTTGAQFALGTTFHPTFLYESLWSAGTVLLLLYIDKHWRPRGGSLFGLYVAFYGIGRFWIEGLRVDPADEIGPFRWNQWVALAAVVVGAGVFFALRDRPDPEPDADRGAMLADDDDEGLDDEGLDDEGLDDEGLDDEGLDEDEDAGELDLGDEDIGVDSDADDDDARVSAGLADDELDGEDPR